MNISLNPRSPTKQATSNQTRVKNHKIKKKSFFLAKGIKFLNYWVFSKHEILHINCFLLLQSCSTNKIHQYYNHIKIMKMI
ncbi:hypothetical protein Hanom_Chr08g00719831 [Helianthus anomalus]